MKVRSLVRNISLTTLATVMVMAFNNCSPFQGSGVQSSEMASGSTCALAASSLRNPTTFTQVTALINALPKPLTLPCFLENLSSPLDVVATQSNFGAQPSASADDPRVFIVRGRLVLSVVVSGVGKDLLEFGEFINSTESVKGELEFPIEDTISESDIFDGIVVTGGTSCRVCHSSERGVTGYAGNAYASSVVRPDSFYRQYSPRLRNVALGCDSSVDSYRCEMLRSIFVTGRARDSALPQ